MYTVMLTAPTICLTLAGMPKEISQSFQVYSYPNDFEIEKLCRKFSLENDVDLDTIKIKVSEVRNS